MLQLTNKAALCAFAGVTVLAIATVAVYSYVHRYTPVLYQTQSVDIAPLLFVQNPFRDKSREVAAERLLIQMRGNTVTESLQIIQGVRFNNPSGYVEQGNLATWELSNRADAVDKSTFHYFIYRDVHGVRVLSFATVTVTRNESGWVATEYKGLGTSNNS